MAKSAKSSLDMIYESVGRIVEKRYSIALNRQAPPPQRESNSKSAAASKGASASRKK